MSYTTPSGISAASMAAWRNIRPAATRTRDAGGRGLDRQIVEPLGYRLLNPEQIEPNEIIGRWLAVGPTSRPECGVDIIEEPIVDPNLSPHG